MSLTWKDAVGTLLVGAAGVVAYARIKGFDWPLLGSWRMGTLVLLVIGLGTCIIVGSGVTPTKDVWTMLATGLGILALVIAILGLVTGSKIAFMALVANIIILWALTTVRHILQ